MPGRKRRGHGEGGISAYQTNAGERFSIVFRAYDPQQGEVRQFRKRGFVTRKSAQDALRECVRDVAHGQHVAPATATLETWVEHWLEGERGQLRASTWDSYARNLRVHVLPTLGNKKLQTIQPADIGVLYAMLLERGRADHAAGTGLSTTTTRYVATILRKCLQAAVDQGRLLTTNPAAKIKPPKVRSRGDRHQIIRYWTGDQVAAFLARSRHQRHHVGWHLLVMTGMRRGEALGLSWDAVDLDGKTVSIRRTLVDVRPGGQPVWSDPKTARGRRVVRLDDGTVTKLRAHRASQTEERLQVGTGYQDHGLVFAMPDGRPIHPDRFSREFTQTVGRTDLPAIRLHDLRHTWATLALQMKTHPKVVQERLGHANIAITLDTYSHVIPSMESDAAERVADLIAGFLTPDN